MTKLLLRVLSSWLSAHHLTLGGATALADETEPAAAEWFAGPGQKFLHVGCGPARKPHVGPGFQSDEWH